MGPLAQAAAFIVGIVALVVAVIVGGVVLAALVGLALMAWLVIYVRLWWLGKNSAKEGSGDQIIDAEYRVVETTRGDDDTE
jgi:hypothetical protein